MMKENSGLKLRKQRAMRRKDAKKLQEDANKIISPIYSRTIIRAETMDGIEIYLYDGKALLARNTNILFPTLIHPNLDDLPSVIVDMGAIPYVCNGADIMAPGIVDIRDNFNEGELVVIKDEKHGKFLSIGISLVSSEDIREMEEGKAIKNIHHVGDKLWITIR
jgi:PUA domain protein